jgi:flap endonuclease-1
MGIRYLNKYLREKCSNDNNSIRIISIAQLSGKKIAVDISIYLYKFVGDEQLIENVYLMLSIFKYYNIIPIFIFDGRPPTEKKELLLQRREEKTRAEKEFMVLKKTLENNIDIEETERQEIINNMDILKKKFIHISREKIQTVKNLIKYYGMTYYDAPGEADKLCAILNIKGKVWGCLSEDMDMFVYGCKNVLRYLSLLNHTVVLYDTKHILKTLDISLKELKEICILSGTDYNLDKNNKTHDLYTTFKYFNKFKIQKNKNLSKNIDRDVDKDLDNDMDNFYKWLLNNSNYIDDYDCLKNTIDLFDLDKRDNIKEFINFDNIKIINGAINFNDMKNILKEDGFIFS